MIFVGQRRKFSVGFAAKFTMFDQNLTWLNASVGLAAVLGASTFLALYLLLKEDENFNFEDRNGSSRNKSRVVTLRKSIPRIHIGEIIGKNGESIKAIQRKTNTYIKCTNTKDEDNMPKIGSKINSLGKEREIREDKVSTKEMADERYSTNKHCQILIRGASLDVMLAEELIETIVYNQRNALVEHIYIDPTHVGIVIGSKGVTIKGISNESGAKVNVRGDSRNTSTPCPIEIRGKTSDVLTLLN